LASPQRLPAMPTAAGLAAAFAGRKVAAAA
jgi:hypothetical protein